MNFFKQDQKTALEAKGLAQWIAFSPVIFQVARVMRNSGILRILLEKGSEGLTLEEIREQVRLPRYGVRVLLESALGIGLVVVNDEKYTITKTGTYIYNDPLTQVNMNFIQDVCYKGLFFLDKSIKTGKPEGLKTFGEWDTIYDGLSSLPADIQKSWFAFDHYFSDLAFPPALSKVYTGNIKKILDIGGNTGKWAIASARFDPDIEITIMDLPGQLQVARKNVEEAGLSERIHFYPANLLDEQIPFPKGFDAIWMSQFLDCFSEDEIVSILKRCFASVTDDQYVLILEAFWDNQRFETAAFCLQQTSIYFTALANGNSQMYHSAVFIRCIELAGFFVEERIDDIGLSHSLLKCKKRKKNNKSFI
ncbi:MAG TPA: class I SAM-dependent methyltransferase [Puia sp.]